MVGVRVGVRGGVVVWKYSVCSLCVRVYGVRVFWACVEGCG